MCVAGCAGVHRDWRGRPLPPHDDHLVVEEPLSGPLITGNLPSYNLGDTVRLNCSLAVREANLTWYVNGHKVRQRLAERRLKEIFR